MDYYLTLIEVIDYIDEYLFEKDLLSNIHKHFYISKYHFLRIFQSGTKFTLGTYVRRRKFTIIADRVKDQSERLIDIAMDLNYTSHEAFTRAFKSYFNIGPKSFSKSPTDNPLLYQEKLNKSQLNYVYYKMDITPSIEKVQKTVISCIESSTSLTDLSISELWNEFGMILKTSTVKSVDEYGYTLWLDQEYDARDLGVEETYRVAVGVEIIDNTKADHLTDFTINEGSYACFSIGDNYEHVLQLYTYIYFVWFAKSEYELGEGFIFEKYSKDFSIESRTGEMMIYIPITKQ